MDVDGASADPFAIDLAQEAMDILRCDRCQLAAAELPHDARPVSFVASLLGSGEQAPVAGKGGGLGPLLEFQMLEPNLDRVLEARVPHPGSYLLFGFDLGDHPAHLPVGALLVQEVVADFAAALYPAARGIGFEPRSPQPALPLLSRRVAPLRLVERHPLVGSHDQSAGLSQVNFHLQPPVP